MGVKLGELCIKIGSGATPRGGKEAYYDAGISLIRSQNVLDYEFSPAGLAHINGMQAEKLKNVIVEDGDVLLNITGDSVARACMADPEYLPARVNQHVCIIRANSEKVLGSYILYYLQMNKLYLLQLAAGGATRNALTKDMIKNLELELPPLDKQKRIVSLLNVIQSKIKKNYRINKNLHKQRAKKTILRDGAAASLPASSPILEDELLGSCPIARGRKSSNLRGTLRRDRVSTRTRGRINRRDYQ